MSRRPHPDGRRHGGLEMRAPDERDVAGLAPEPAERGGEVAHLRLGGQYRVLHVETHVNGDLVDEVVVPAALPADNSYARLSEDKIDLHKASRLFDDKEWQMRDGSCDSLAITPRKFNARPVNSNIDKFYNHDRRGVVLTLFAMGIVFSALALLFICFLLFGKVFEAQDKKAKQGDAAAAAVDVEPEHKAQPGSNDEAIAAICMALYQHLNAHDVESGILTFDHSHDMPSAWGSKGNLLMPTPEHHQS